MGVKLFATLVSSMVIVVIIIGLYLVGSPLKERQHRFDSLRVNDLQGISSAIDQYYKQTGHLPSTLNDLLKPEVARLYYLRSITDPQNSTAYDYTITNKTDYRLCATFTFATPTKNTPLMNYSDQYNQAWKHSAGKQCYDLQAKSPK